MLTTIAQEHRHERQRGRVEWDGTVCYGGVWYRMIGNRMVWYRAVWNCGGEQEEREKGQGLFSNHKARVQTAEISWLQSFLLQGQQQEQQGQGRDGIWTATAKGKYAKQ